jgi:NADPH:quinone reductase-like Zn-dependent oxidoreductase
MRAALLVGFGGPETLVIRDDVPVPVPSADEVLVEVRACGVNNTDVNTRIGWYSGGVASGTPGRGTVEAVDAESGWSGRGFRLPRIQGADVCGHVVAVGSDSDAALLGRRVLVDPWRRDPDEPDNRELAGYLGSDYDGGFAEYCAVPAANAYPIDSALTDEELATFACSWSAAEHMLQRVGLAAGQTIAVTGASGGVGSALVGLAKRRAARVVAVAGGAKAGQVLELGADRVVARGDGAVDDAVAVNGGPFDVVADGVGGEQFMGWLGALRRGGRYVTSGAIAGPVVQLDLRTLYLKDLELVGATVFGPQVFAALVGYIERGEVRPALAGTYPLDRIHEAQEVFGRKEHVGSFVITI